MNLRQDLSRRSNNRRMVCLTNNSVVDNPSGPKEGRSYQGEVGALIARKSKDQYQNISNQNTTYRHSHAKVRAVAARKSGNHCQNISNQNTA